MRIKMVSKKALSEAYREWCFFRDTNKFDDKTIQFLVGNSCNILDSIQSCDMKNARAVLHYGKIQGAIAFSEYADYINVDYICTAPFNIIGIKRRLPGVGSRLIGYIFKRAAKNNRIKYISLISHPDAKKFYEDLGFVEVDDVMKISRRKFLIGQRK